MADRTLADPQAVEIEGLNRRIVRIRWRSGEQSVYRAADLRRACPCATCHDKRGDGPSPEVSDGVMAVGMAPVGRYALQISWSDGHTSGIYPFRFLSENCGGRLQSDPSLLESPEAAAPAAEVPEARRVTPETSMESILELYPAAQRALFQRFHIGGCQSCGFEPHDSLAEVCRKRNVPDVEQVIQLIYAAGSFDARMQLSVEELTTWQAEGRDFALLDVREPHEYSAGSLAGARLLDVSLQDEIKANWPKDKPLVLYCARGVRSLDKAAWFAGHGFKTVKSLSGGYHAWRAQAGQQ